MDWVGIAAIIVVGLAIIIYGYLSDRQRTKRAIEEATAPPKRDIPGFAPTTETPHYLSELQARTRPDDSATDLGSARRDELTAAIRTAHTVPAGYPDASWVTDSTTRWAVLDQPLIAVCAEPVSSIREVLPLAERAKQSGRPLVVVAPEIALDVVDTLRANMVQGTLANVPIGLSDPDALAAAATATGATPISSQDLHSGYVTVASLGSATTWVSGPTTSWAITDET